MTRAGGGYRRIKYIGRRGAADDLVFFKWNRIFLVETKRPKGGKISVHQREDATWLFGFGVLKVYLYTVEEVDAWIRKTA